MDPITIIIIGIAVVLFCIIVLRLHAFIALLFAALVTGILTPPELIREFALHQGMSETAATGMASQVVGKRLALAFGNTAGKIGILIALASIIGTSLMKSGGAERIVRSLLKLFGKNNASLAFLSGSFTLAIPVFFDTVFYLMIPLVKSISVRNPAKFSLYLMSMAAGGVMAHSLVPPTPGPLFVAQELKIDLGTMMIGGVVVGIITTLAGYWYAVWANKRWELPLRDTPDISIEELKRFSGKRADELPGLWVSLLPIMLPIILITGYTFLNMYLGGSSTTGSSTPWILSLFRVIGDPNMALAISACVALLLLWNRTKDLASFKKSVTESLTSAGMIILITSAGGAFGQMLQQTAIGIRIEDMAAGYQMAILPLAFLITAMVRTAQGSATVAMVTAIGVMSGFASSNLGFHPVYIALAIGCGSKIFAWMNDSGFWIVSKMSGMTEKETVRHFSFLMMVMAIAGLIAVMVLSNIFPLT